VLNLTAFRKGEITEGGARFGGIKDKEDNRGGEGCARSDCIKEKEDNRGGREALDRAASKKKEDNVEESVALDLVAPWQASSPTLGRGETTQGYERNTWLSIRWIPKRGRFARR
jgi:hypothetical protein